MLSETVIKEKKIRYYIIFKIYDIEVGEKPDRFYAQMGLPWLPQDGRVKGKVETAN